MLDRLTVEMRVLPAGVGWELDGPGFFEPLQFLSGAHAEMHARALAGRLARNGVDAAVEVYDRSMDCVGAFRCHAAPWGGCSSEPLLVAGVSPA